MKNLKRLILIVSILSIVIYQRGPFALAATIVEEEEIFFIEEFETLEELLDMYRGEYLTDRILPELIARGWNINSINDISLTDDYDDDGLTLDEEYRYNTDPFNTDTDMDGLTDYEEIIIYNTEPLMYDTDDDGIRDKTEVFVGLNPLSYDTDDDGIIDSEEITTQLIELEVFETIDINKTKVKPSMEITGAGDYYGKIYAAVNVNNVIINNMKCVVGTAFEFLHDETLSFESSTLTFTISDEVLQETPLEDLAIAYYDYDNSELKLLDTIYPSRSNNIGGENGGKANNNVISAIVDHYSTYMVVNKKILNNPYNTDSRNTDVFFRIVLWFTRQYDFPGFLLRTD